MNGKKIQAQIYTLYICSVNLMRMSHETLFYLLAMICEWMVDDVSGCVDGGICVWFSFESVSRSAFPFTKSSARKTQSLQLDSYEASASSHSISLPEQTQQNTFVAAESAVGVFSNVLQQ